MIDEEFNYPVILRSSEESELTIGAFNGFSVLKEFGMGIGGISCKRKDRKVTCELKDVEKISIDQDDLLFDYTRIVLSDKNSSFGSEGAKQGFMRVSGIPELLNTILIPDALNPVVDCKPKEGMRDCVLTFEEKTGRVSILGITHLGKAIRKWPVRKSDSFRACMKRAKYPQDR